MRKASKPKKDETVSHYCLSRNQILQGLPASNYTKLNYIPTKTLNELYPDYFPTLYKNRTQQPTLEENNEEPVA